MRMLDIYESVGVKYYTCFDVPSAPGPWIHRNGFWISSIDVSVRHEAATGVAVLNDSAAFRHADGDISVAPAGLRFDGGSKPRASWVLFGHPWNEYLFAYAIHDSDWDEIWQAFYRREITAGMRRQYLRVADRNFKTIQRAIKRDWLGKRGNLIERARIRVKHLAVRAFSHVRALGGNPNA